MTKKSGLKPGKSPAPEEKPTAVEVLPAVDVKADNGGMAVNVQVPQGDVWVFRILIIICALLLIAFVGAFLSLVMARQTVPPELSSMMSTVIGAILGLLTPNAIQRLK